MKDKRVSKDLNPKSIFDNDFCSGDVGWCSPDNISRLFELMEGTVFVSSIGSLRYIPISRQTRLKLVLVENPRKEFFEYIKDIKPNNKTFIAPSASIGKNTIIHAGCYIDHGVIIGDNCTIGGDGFGYEDGQRVNHIGNVHIHPNVHIGSNTCIDRAVLGSTEIGEGSKIDNLVHIAHGVKIGKRSMIIAGTVLCGSVTVGDDCWIAPNSSVRQKVKIGDGATVGLGSVVLKDVAPGSTVYGVPAK